MPTSGPLQNILKGDLAWSTHADFGTGLVSPNGDTPDDPTEALCRQLEAGVGTPPKPACVPDSNPELNVGHKIDIQQLRIENTQLRTRVEELEQALDAAGGQDSATMREQLKEYEALLEEKTEVIRDLHRRLQEQQDRQDHQDVGQLHQQPQDRPTGGAPGEAELLALSEELERERQQLKEDEESLMKQMRDMEVQMSRERAEMARQRNEFQRLQNDIRHELEMASRDSALRERLAPLQRRQQEMLGRRGAAPPPEEGGQAQTNGQAGGYEAPPRKEGNIFRRLFG
jgi:hypothetical protein